MLSTIAVYSIVALGMVALGAHVSTNARRVLKAVELLAGRAPAGGR